MNSGSGRQISAIILRLRKGWQIFDSWLYDEKKPFIHMVIPPPHI